MVGQSSHVVAAPSALLRGGRISLGGLTAMTLTRWSPVSGLAALEIDRLNRMFDSAFRRSFTMPASVDGSAIVAEYQDGVLTVKLPRRSETRPRQIQIN